MMDKNKRPLTQREIRKLKSEKKKTEYVTIYNKNRKRPISIQLKSPPNVDWYTGEQTTNIPPGKTERFPAHRLYPEQVINHEKAGRISVLSGKEYIKTL